MNMLPNEQIAYHPETHLWVSSLGRVFFVRHGELHECRLHAGRLGYLRIASDGYGDRGRLVHTLVRQCFLGPLPAGHVTRHLNSVKTDNRVENLRIGTPAEFARDHLPYDWTDVRNIRQRYAVVPGVTQADLARDYGVSEGVISAIIRNKTWHDPHYTPPKPKRHPPTPYTPPERLELDDNHPDKTLLHGV